MDIPVSELSWMQTFFSSPNMLGLEILNSDRGDNGLREEVSGWLTLLNSKRPILLPRKSTDGMHWYVCSDNEQIATRVGVELDAMIGSAYVRVNLHSQIDSTDTCENILVERFGPHICRLDVKPGGEAQVLRMIGVYRHLVEHRAD